MKNNTTVTTTNYISGFHYENDALKFFATAEGYVNHTLSQGISFYNYIYNYTDHLGNNRLSYTLNQTLGNVVIYEQNHYYPFGLKHEKYGVTAKQYIGDEDTGYYTGNVGLTGRYRRNEYQYKYNGMEYQDELELNFYDYGARNYDPAIGRWMNIDPLAEQMRRHSPYNYAFNNPVYFIDPDGMAPDDWYKNIFTSKVTWKEGTGSKLGHQHLGYSWGSTDVNGNRLQMDGSTKKITYNGEVRYDYNDKKLSGGFAFSDGGNNQNPNALRKGGRDAEWIDFKGTLNTAIALLNLKFGRSSSNGKGANGGNSTIDNKTSDAIDAVSFGADATKEVLGGQTNIRTVSLDTTNYHINTTDRTVTGKTGQMPFTGTPESLQKSKDSLDEKDRFYKNWFND